MRKYHVRFAVCLLPLLAIGCRRDVPQSHLTDLPDRVQATDDTQPAGMAQGKVIETVDAAQYTYVQIDTGSEKIWAAAPRCEVKVGDELQVAQNMPMPGWRSKTLDRDFGLVYFVSEFRRPDGTPVPKAGSEAATQSAGSGHAAGPRGVDVGSIEKAEGGLTVAEIYAQKAELKDKEVTLRGKVTKYNPQIMGRNWLHMQDGSGDENAGTHDLTVTTKDEVAVGDVVLVTGTLHLDRDFSAGYKYDVIIEDAKVVVE